MRQLIERLRSEKLAIEQEEKERHESEAGEREQAFDTGKAVAKIWIKSSSYKEIKNVLHHQAAKRDLNSFGSKINNFFASIEKVCPEEAQRYKWLYNDSFMNGWQEGVFIIWESIRKEVDDESMDRKRK